MSKGNVPPEEEAVTLVDDAVAAVSSIRDATARAIAAGALLNHLNDAILEVKDTRYVAMKKLNEQGVSYTALAETIGLSKSRVQQILTHMAPTKRMGRVEMEARQEAQRLRDAGKSDADIVKETVPRLIALRSAERYTPAQIADMLNVPTSLVQSPWNSARRAKERDIASRRP